MRVERRSIFPAPAEDVWDLLLKPETLERITRGFVGMEPVEVPDEIREGSVLRLKLRILNLPPAIDYEMRFMRIDPDGHEVVTQEHGGVILRWVHRITIEPLSAGRCMYTDRIDIEAGLATPLVAAFAQVFYRVRQRRWLEVLGPSESTAEA